MRELWPKIKKVCGCIWHIPFGVALFLDYDYVWCIVNFAILYLPNLLKFIYPKTAFSWFDIVFQAKDAFDGSSKCKILEPSDIANAVIYATSQPEYVGVNEILIEPREAPVWKPLFSRLKNFWTFVFQVGYHICVCKFLSGT
jgi:hypothetical protein